MRVSTKSWKKCVPYETSGIPSPWIRGLPRLSTEVKKLPMPVVAAVSYADGAHYMNIKNFTLGGLLLEHNGNEVSDLSVASRIELELVTNGGEKLGQMVGSVTHISAEINDVNPSASRYQIGLKFVSMPAAIELRYRGLIREHCQALKSELGADADVG